MKKRVVGLVLILAVAAASYWGYTKFTGQENGGLQATGTIEATQVNLAAKLPGVLEFVSVKQGDTVKKDQLVAKIIRRDLTAQKERDALTVDKAEAQLSDLISGARREEISDALAGVKTAEANLERADSDYTRGKALNQVGATSGSDLEKYETALKVAKSQVEQAQARLSLLESGSRPDQIRAARLELERNRAILKATDAQLEDTMITCPINGTVTTRNFETGEYVAAGSAVATLADLTDLWIKIYISTDDLPRIKLGQQVSFTVSGNSGKFSGTIVEIASKGEFTPKTIQTRQERTNIVYAVKVKIDNREGLFKPGMPADVVIGQGD